MGTNGLTAIALLVATASVGLPACAENTSDETGESSSSASTTNAPEELPESCDVCARSVPAGEVRTFVIRVPAGAVARVEATRLSKIDDRPLKVSYDGKDAPTTLPTPDRIYTISTLALGNRTADSATYSVVIDNTGGSERATLTDRIEEPSSSMFCWLGSPCTYASQTGTCVAEPTFHTTGDVGVCTRQ
jgi:hypothetical protein